MTSQKTVKVLVPSSLKKKLIEMARKQKITLSTFIRYHLSRRLKSETEANALPKEYLPDFQNHRAIGSQKIVKLIENPYLSRARFPFACVIDDDVYEVFSDGLEDYDIRSGDKVKILFAEGMRCAILPIQRSILTNHSVRKKLRQLEQLTACKSENQEKALLHQANKSTGASA